MHNDQAVGEGTKDPVTPGHVMNEPSSAAEDSRSSPKWMWRVGGTCNSGKWLELRLMMRGPDYGVAGLASKGRNCSNTSPRVRASEFT